MIVIDGAAVSPRAYPSSGRWGTLGLLVVIVALAFFAVQSTRLGTGSLLARMAQLEVDRWTASNSPGGERLAVRANDYLSLSLLLSPDNPWALEQLGALDLARMRLSTVPKEAQESARNARAQFRGALLQRPTAPFLWANLALSKLYLDEIDEELFAALRHADVLGTWERPVQRVTLFVGLAVWGQLDAGLKQMLVRTIERGALRDAGKMYEIVKSFGRLDLVCGIRRYDPVAGDDCKPRQKAATRRR